MFIITIHLYKLTEARHTFNQTKEFEKSSTNIKQVLTSLQMLGYLEIDNKIILDSDANNEGIGAVLSESFRNEETFIV